MQTSNKWSCFLLTFLVFFGINKEIVTTKRMKSNVSEPCSRRSLMLFAAFGIVCLVGVTVCIIVTSSSVSQAKRSDNKRMEANLKSNVPHQDLDRDQDAKYALNTSGANLPQGRKVCG